MSLEPDRISLVGGSVVIQVGPETTDSWNGIRLKRDGTYVLQGSGQKNRNITGWEFDATATPQNPITVQVQGTELTLIVDPSIPQRVSAGEILFKAVDPFWTPANLPGVICHFNFGNGANYAETPWSFSDEIGNTSLVQSGVLPLPTYNPNDGTLDFANAVLEFSGPNFPWDFTGGAAASGFFASFASVNQGRVFKPSSDFQYVAVNDNGRGLGVRRLSNSNAIWDGLLDPADPSLPYERRYTGGSSAVDIPYRHAATSTEIPSATPTFFICSWLSQGQNPMRDLGQSNSAVYSIRQAGVISSFRALSTDDKLRLQGYLTWDLVNAGLADLDDLMSSSHPHYSGPPTFGGGVSGVTLVVPAESITITGIPQGSSVVVSQAGRTLDTVNEVAGSYTYQIKPNESNTYRIKVIATGFRDFEQLLDIAEGRSTIYFGVPSDSSDTLSKSYAEFFDLMQGDAAFQAVASSAGNQGSRILQQLWQNPAWQADWNVAVTAVTPSTAEISDWIGYIATSGFTAISFNPTTGEVA